MLDLPEIAIDDFETQMANFINHAYLYNSSWNLRGEHSIGVVLAELFVFLKVTQQENMNKISPESLMRICKLAGGNIVPLTPATSTISVNGTGSLLCGTKLIYSDIVFETSEEIHLPDNKIEKVSYWDGGAINSSNYISNDNINIKLFNTHDNLIIGFGKPFETGIKSQLYISLDYNSRTPVTDKEDFLNVIGRNNLRWQYYGLENETVGWHDLDIIADDTLSLLFSGIISWRIKGVHYEKDGCYPIMCVLENDFYDIYPSIKQIYLNAIECKQTDTKCTKISFSYKEFINDAMYINNYLAETENFKLFMYTDLGFVLADDPDIAQSIIYDGGRLRLVTAAKKEMNEVFCSVKDLTEDTEVITLILYESNYLKEYISNGTSNMTFKIDSKGVLCDSLSIMVGTYIDDGLYWEEWSYVPDLLYYGADDKVFSFSEDSIITGDNKNGKIPYKSPDGKSKNIIISSLALSQGANGNIPAGTFECSTLVAALDEVIRINDSVDGKNRELPQDMLNNILLTRPQGTLVTKKDFINAAVCTEGLIIDKVTCELPIDENGDIEANAVDITIYPGLSCASSKKTEWYKKAVSNKLMKYKPLTLKMNIRIADAEQ